ncbi:MULTISPECIES: hypothetical protein [Streptomyces]|uniref:Uncharacterized protein n=1 Tax=Streptomyces solicathayae TaxID=3081768 RepID=A0ABZ0LSA4_9ACTN|nr:hypothetical protein [Streptomyces sp. HUAS YS2]WOX22336.1 hypothetical protein R2D22_13405 [Streptomyces sp. HUAS YS2]
MQYDFWTVRGPVPEEMARALADVVGVPVADVDVADLDGDLEGRRWDAPVLCGYEVRRGDVALYWDVWISGAVPNPPDPATAALRLAAVIGGTVLHSADDMPNPSAYMACLADGRVVRARVDDPEEPDFLFTVDAVEDPVPDLPGARVHLLPEVYWSEPIDLPVTTAFAAETDPDAIAPAQSRANRARETLIGWERLVRRMAGDWGPTGRYPEESYLEDLRTRDSLARRLADAPPALEEPFARAADALDEVFRAHSSDDGGEFLGRVTKSGTAVRDRGWWWQRRPRRVPWPQPR